MKRFIPRSRTISAKAETRRSFASRASLAVLIRPAAAAGLAGGALAGAGIAMPTVPAVAASVVAFQSAGCQTWPSGSTPSTVTITAVGSAGQNGSNTVGTGGTGDSESATLSGLGSAQKLYICVDENGGAGGGAGGGASGVSLGTDFSKPVVIAAGGGGGGQGFGGQAGNGGTPATRPARAVQMVRVDVAQAAAVAAEAGARALRRHRVRAA